jgi:hypothetical protein
LNNTLTSRGTGTKVLLSSPYTDDVNAADPVEILGEK